jgi:antitoxin component YwqK of YwqJK toxin-antitoxin module
VNDLKEGRSYYYREEGKLREIVNFKAGKRNGVSLEYGGDSLVVVYRLYVNDILVENERLNRTDKNGKRQGVWKDFYIDGRVKREAYYRNDTLDGLYKEFNEKGAMIASLVYRDGKIKEYNAEDTASVEIRNKYDENGNLIYSGPYRKNTPIGIHREYKDGKIKDGKLYSDNGILLGEGIIDEEGKKTGNWKYYYVSGEIKSKGAYLNNQRSGKWTFYYKNNKILQQGEYKNDLPEGHWIWYYPENIIWREEEYLAGKEDGHTVEYDLNSQVITEGDFVEGEREGKWIYKVGDHREEGSYITGLRDGVWKYYYDNGNLEFQGNYIQGNPDGKHLYYYDTGELKEEDYYVMGLREKNWKKFDKLGNILITITYKDDQEYRVNGKKLELPAEIRIIR